MYFTLGIGLNVNSSQKFLQSIEQKATSLKEEYKEKFDKLEVLSQILLQFKKNISLIDKKNTYP